MSPPHIIISLQPTGTTFESAKELSEAVECPLIVLPFESHNIPKTPHPPRFILFSSFDTTTDAPDVLLSTHNSKPSHDLSNHLTRTLTATGFKVSPQDKDDAISTVLKTSAMDFAAALEIQVRSDRLLDPIWRDGLIQSIANILSPLPMN